MGTTSKTVNLALQGGGAHGAFTWGVLDRLLDDERMSFEGICATSAGAMNAAVMAYGLTIGGREAAKHSLAEFWRRISEAAAWGPLQPSPFDRLVRTRALEKSPVFMFFEMMTRLLSPYQFNPLNYNPLRDVLEETVDFERLRRNNVIKLFLCATNVRTGKVKIFHNDELTVSAVLASGCLPLLFQAIEIDGEAYWDGGYMGNPAIFPLIYGCQSTDVIVIHINPIVRQALPRTASDILNRINEISFNSSLMREMRAIAFANKLVSGGAAHDQIKTMLIHAIEADSLMKDLGVASKYNADWEFLTHLRDIGRTCAEEWLAANFCHLGMRSTIDIHARYL
ncbi:alpha/beta hydrolase [Bradyrhizobium forestalis]|uniref:Alpha/beta hydrolase n=1 Tax=Bradyrhizobium forestalis TaxID=1419263 RepID=A0A2M8R0A7_9BRAD|nr:patatin-like phospholipase family protein [Bradyrhizobium forestalis]PJG51247.1 alpha/beta hydrolase [Bradyrhizobium forestalis]